MIEKAKPEDFEEITKLHMYLVEHLKGCNPSRYKIDKKETLAFKEKLKRLIDTPKALILIDKEKNGLITGYAIGKIKVYPPIIKEDNYGELDEVVVNPKFRNRGIGLRLAKTIIEFFKSNNIKIVELLVDSKNTVAMKAWSKLGFSEELKIMTKKINVSATLLN